MALGSSCPPPLLPPAAALSPTTISSPTAGWAAQEWPSLPYLPQGAAPQIASTGPGCIPVALGSHWPLLRCCSPPLGFVVPLPEAGWPSPFLCRTVVPAGLVQWPPPRLLLAAPLVHSAGVLPAGPRPFQAPALPEQPWLAPLAQRSGSPILRPVLSSHLVCLAPRPLVAEAPPVSRKSPRP